MAWWFHHPPLRALGSLPQRRGSVDCGGYDLLDVCFVHFLVKYGFIYSFLGSQVLCCSWWLCIPPPTGPTIMEVHGAALQKLGLSRRWQVAALITQLACSDSRQQ